MRFLVISLVYSLYFLEIMSILLIVGCLKKFELLTQVLQIIHYSLYLCYVAIIDHPQMDQKTKDWLQGLGCKVKFNYSINLS